MITLSFEGKPVAKARPRFSKRGTYNEPRTVEAEARIRADVVEFMGNHAPIEGAVQVVLTYTIEPPASWSAKKRREAIGSAISTRPDVDNYAKLTLDACNGALFVDDGQIARLTVNKIYGEPARTVLQLRNI